MPLLAPHAEGTLVALKVVPGASREGVAGVLGERLKVRVSAAPEGGKANRAVCAVLARALGVSPRDVAIVAGASQPEKSVLVRGITPEDAARALDLSS